MAIWAAVSDSLNAERETLVQEIGENMTIRRGQVVESAEGALSYYVHGDQRRAAIVQLSTKSDEVGRDLAMHVVAINPMVVKREDVSEDVLNKEREIYLSQAQDSGKPEEIVAKMVEGRVNKYLAEVSLLDQPFVKDGNTKVGCAGETSQYRRRAICSIRSRRGHRSRRGRLCRRSGGAASRQRIALCPDCF